MRQAPLYAIAAALNFMLAIATSVMGGAMQAPPLFLATAWFALMALLCVLGFIHFQDEADVGETPEPREEHANQAPLCAIAAALNFIMAIMTSVMGGAMQAPPLFLAAAWFAAMTFLFAALAFICAEDEGGKSPAANSGDARKTVRS